MRSSKVCIITRSSLASLPLKAWQPSTQLLNGLLWLLNGLNGLPLSRTGNFKIRKHQQLSAFSQNSKISPKTMLYKNVFWNHYKKIILLMANISGVVVTFTLGGDFCTIILKLKFLFWKKYDWVEPVRN